MMSLAVFAVALAYSAVGHGGASGYLAVMALAGIAPRDAASGALLLNLLVAGLAFTSFRRAGLRPGPLILPFLAGSVPAAAFGAWVTVPHSVYNGLLAMVLLAAAVRMVVIPSLHTGADEAATPPPVPARIAFGAAIGLVSGVVGVGGGILLSPLLVWRRWAGVRQTAAASAVFIVVNSAVGISARAAAGTFAPRAVLPFLLAAAAGGWLGAHAGSQRLGISPLRRVLAGVLVVAAAAKAAG